MCVLNLKTRRAIMATNNNILQLTSPWLDPAFTEITLIRTNIIFLGNCNKDEVSQKEYSQFFSSNGEPSPLGGSTGPG